MAMIMPAVSLSPREVHQFAHPPDACLEPAEDGLADKIVANVEFRELGNRGDRLDVLISEAVPGVRLDAVLGGERSHVGNALQFRGASVTLRMGIFAGVEFDHGGAKPQCRLNLAGFRRDEQADANPGISQALYYRVEAVVLACGIKATAARKSSSSG